MKNILCLFFAIAILAACKSEPKQSEAIPEKTELTPEESEGGTLEHLRKKAIPEEDRLARVSRSFEPVQEEYRKAEGVVPGVGKVTIFVDKEFNLLIKNEVGDDVIRTQVNLKHLDPNDGGMRLVPDMTQGEFPGLKIKVLSGREGVKITKNDEPVSEERELSIFLADRPSIERITPAISQALNVVHNKS